MVHKFGGKQVLSFNYLTESRCLDNTCSLPQTGWVWEALTLMDRNRWCWLALAVMKARGSLVFGDYQLDCTGLKEKADTHICSIPRAVKSTDWGSKTHP